MESPLQLPPIPPPPKTKRFSTIILIALVLVSLVAGCGIGYAVTYADFNNKLSNIQGQLGLYQGTSTNSQTYLLNDNVSLSTLYQNTKSSGYGSRSRTSIQHVWC